ncbi:MAG: EAL domain-containing protein, partial [Chromatiales bacterium]|nr:EAL domain-containing protein [Chromatiales bacterium]
LMTLITLQNEDRSVSNINPIDETLHSARTVHSARPMLLVNRTGREHIIQYTVAPILEQGELYGSITVLHDVTELHSLNDQLQFHASHDALTGLINRREFERLLQQAVDNARKQGTTHALCYLDLDQFKIVNDTCGHLAGDELLKQLANHLRDELRAADVLARLGGDEFGVLLENCPLDVAETIADTLRLTVKEHRFTWDGKPFEIGVSIGIVPISADSGTLYDILRYADSACYMAKDLGRNCIKVFSLSSEGFVPPNEEIQWSQRIEQALENGHFCLHAEPIQSLQNSGSGHQHELLLRMQEDGENCIPPMAFIPAAERYNLMPQIDRWVISEAFRSFASEQQSIEKNNLLFTINISGQSLNDSTFVKFLEETLKGSTIDTSRVCFELSESAAITNLEAARKLIQTARKYGANFALDDFGTGFSSFSYLKNLPVNYVKIDGSFIRDIHDNPMDQLMVDSINRTCKLLHMQTIAEFVETETAFDTLQKMGIDYAQGWYLGNSRPLSEIYTAANQ